MEHESNDCANCDWWFRHITKELLKVMEDLEVGGRVETIQTTALLRMARIQRGVLET